MSIDQRAADLGRFVQEIMKQFQAVHAAASNGPHVSLNQQELRVVELLGQEGSQMMRALAEHLSLAVNSVTSIVDGLEQKQLILRQRSEEDRRIVRVELTETGRQSYQALTGAKLQLFKSILHPLTDDEQEILLVLFRKIARASHAPSDSVISDS